MIKLTSITLAAALAFGGAALAQDTGNGSTDQAEPPPSEGPIVGGKDLQPTQGEITDRLMQQREQGGKRGQLPPQQNDKELDDLYRQLLEQSGPTGGGQ
jgi:hypothetical protein